MIAIVDYGVGNLFSLNCSFKSIGAEVCVTADPEEIARADRIILPGVGAFEDAARKLYETYHPEVVVVTQGKRGGILFDGEKIISYPIYPAEVVDSNGSGDVFHGAFAAGMAYGFDFEKCCHFSSAVSAMKCMGVGARESVPSFEAVKKYMKENGYEL